MTAGTALIGGLALAALYSWVRSRQHAALSDAYRFAHEQTHDTDRGYYPDRYTGLGPAECREIADRFREVETTWWIWGNRKQRAVTERRIAEWMSMNMTEPSDGG